LKFKCLDTYHKERERLNNGYCADSENSNTLTAHGIQRITDEKKRNIPRENYFYSWL